MEHIVRRLLSAGLCALVLVAVTACMDVASLAQTMNERHISSCLRYQGAYSPFVGLAGLTATGDATIAECSRLQGP